MADVGLVQVEDDASLAADCGLRVSADVDQLEIALRNG